LIGPAADPSTTPAWRGDFTAAALTTASVFAVLLNVRPRRSAMSRWFVAIVLLLTSAAPVAAQAPNVEAGKVVFRQSCALCHAATPGRAIVGPSLFNVVGRRSGGELGYQYSEANQTAGLTWDAATLDRYLADPRATIPGTKMAFAGIANEQNRRDLIAYLATLH
jgi:cytochrome c